MRHLPLIAVTAFTATFITILAIAADMPPPNGEHPKGPPPFAIEACKGRSVGSTVSFNGPDGKTFKGVCREFDGTLAAMPDHPPGHGGGEHKGPPPKPQNE